MTKIALQVEECCESCRRPVSRCRGVACKEPKTYPGVLLRGEWQQVERQPWNTAPVVNRRAA